MVTLLTSRITVAWQADVSRTLEEVLLAPLAVGSVSVFCAILAATSVASPLVQVLVELALVRESIAVASCKRTLIRVW